MCAGCPMLGRFLHTHILERPNRGSTRWNTQQSKSALDKLIGDQKNYQLPSEISGERRKLLNKTSGMGKRLEGI